MDCPGLAAGCRATRRNQQRLPKALGEVGSSRSSDEAGESQWSEVGDGLKSAAPRQLSFVFADSPQGDKVRDSQDESSGKRFLVHTAKGNGRMGPATCTTVTRRLLESVASASNLARALLPELQKSLLEGTYQPGDIRRVWIPKPGGGERGLSIPNVVDRWFNRPCFKCLSRSSSRYSIAAVMDSAPTGALTLPSPRRSSIWERDIRSSWIWTCRIFFNRVHHQRLLARLGQQVHDSGRTAPMPCSQR